jgi:hypothetical protein
MNAEHSRKTIRVGNAAELGAIWAEASTRPQARMGPGPGGPRASELVRDYRFGSQESQRALDGRRARTYNAEGLAADG